MRARAWVRFDWQNDWRSTKNQIGPQRHHTYRVKCDGALPGYIFCSQAIFGGAPQAPRSSQAPRASVAPNYRLPGSSQLVAQIPGSQELPAGNQNHALRAPRGCPLAAGRGRDGELRKGTRAARGPPSEISAVDQAIDPAAGAAAGEGYVG